MLLKSSLSEILSSKIFLQNIAYSNQGNNYSYKKVLSDAENIRQFLSAKVNSRPVIVFGHKQVGMLSSFIGSNASGVAFVPVDESTPIDRIEHIIKLSEAQFIIAVSPFSYKTKCEIASYEEIIKMGPEHELNLEKYVTAEDIAYIIFTSGSTGIPKGVKISIESLDDFLLWSTSLVNDAHSYVFMNHALFSFDLSIFEIWSSICLKGKVVSLEHKNNLNVRANFEILKKEHCSIFVSTPSFADLCLIDGQFSEVNFPHLSHFIFCGEILSKATATRLKRQFPKSKILNLYGPTEATCATTAIEITEEVLAKYEILPVGQVKSGTEIYVDKNHNGEELIIVGKNVSHGYINDSAKTKAQFFLKDGVRAYRTGDYGFFDEDNLLFVKGRIDRQIKFKGYRIELEEIESVMRNVFNISNALCLPISKDDKVIELTAVVPAVHGLVYEEFVQQLKPILPDYMIPTKLNIIDKMPLNSNGKIDRKEVEKILFSKIDKKL